MAASETVLRVPLGSLSQSCYVASFFVNSTPNLSFKPIGRNRKGVRCCTNSHEISSVSRSVSRGSSFHSPNCAFKGRNLVSTKCKCQKYDVVEESIRSTLLPSDGLSSELKSDLDEMPLPVNGSLSSNGGVHSSGPKSIEDEAWDLLRQSVVHYCGSPIGTIAANDPNSTSVLNYDQVFIRDFIPSGIAFLLKGEYDIVRNFILYTLQLQVIQSFFVTKYISMRDIVKCFCG